MKTIYFYCSALKTRKQVDRIMDLIQLNLKGNNGQDFT